MKNPATDRNSSSTASRRSHLKFHISRVIRKKKASIALGVMSTVGASAFAQSSVTLYGLIDAGISYTSNSAGHGLTQTQDMAISQWGLTGAEDLGAGMKAIFQIEAGFSPFNGRFTQNREFGRQAYVGLASNKYGTITLGRQYDTLVDEIQSTTFNGHNYAPPFSHPSDLDNTDDAFRVNNAVKYVTPRWNGFAAEGMYAFGGVAGQFGRNSTVAGGLNYTNGPLYVGAAYLFAKNPVEQFDDRAFVTNVGTAAAPAAPPVGTSNGHGALGFVGKAGSMQLIGVGGTYSIGPVVAGFNFDNVRFDDANQGAPNLPAGVRDAVWFNSYEVWGQYSVTPATSLGLGYTFTHGKDDFTGVKPKYHQVNAIADYHLSKRTDLYVMAIYQKASGTNADIYDGFLGAQSNNTTQFFGRVGIRHAF